MPVLFAGTGQDADVGDGLVARKHRYHNTSLTLLNTDYGIHLALILTSHLRQDARSRVTRHPDPSPPMQPSLVPLVRPPSTTIPLPCRHEGLELGRLPDASRSSAVRPVERLPAAQLKDLN
jgi:hypothetical protein